MKDPIETALNYSNDSRQEDCVNDRWLRLTRVKLNGKLLKFLLAQILLIKLGIWCNVEKPEIILKPINKEVSQLFLKLHRRLSSCLCCVVVFNCFSFRSVEHFFCFERKYKRNVKKMCVCEWLKNRVGMLFSVWKKTQQHQGRDFILQLDNSFFADFFSVAKNFHFFYSLLKCAKWEWKVRKVRNLKVCETNDDIVQFSGFLQKAVSDGQCHNRVKFAMERSFDLYIYLILIT